MSEQQQRFLTDLEDLYTGQVRGYFTNATALLIAIQRSAARMSLSEAVRLWERIAVACGVKPSILMAAVREAEVQQYGQPLGSASRRTASYFSYRMDGGSFNGHHLVYVTNQGRKEV